MPKKKTSPPPFQEYPRAGDSGAYKRYYGKYRGKVLENIDPLFLGRIMVEVAAVPGSTLNWALPCVPYAGLEVGFYAIPPVGANVWIEFEGGDPNYPIWTGCFWAEGEVPLGVPPPTTKIFKTEFITMILNDIEEAGGFILECNPPAVNTPLSMTFDSAGIQINAEPAIITMNPETGITITMPPSVIELTPEVLSAALPSSTLTLSEAATALNSVDVNVSAEGAVQVEATGDITLAASGAANMSAGGDVAVSGGGAATVTAGGDAAVTAIGAVEVSAFGDLAMQAGGGTQLSAIGDVAIQSLTMAISGAGIALNGAVEVDGDLLVDGAQVAVLPF